ncbi:hypothetical protein Q4502_02305 [Mesomycoplasma ovipneumoniae]|uniref:hypothetical protein n=1 Tax=Mesomycoplasma ovipneumoniae TaxID=29562 RepID=UPI0026E23AFC|nr:hypothetical protein [Mesomycoplasma ovipneumoniae]MDO6856535.1 hypothetical protein [Mesomycoplasma ovipneumoniae]
MSFTKKIKKILLNLTALTSLTLAVTTPVIVASQKINAKAFLLFPGIALLANENSVVQLAERNDKDYYFGIGLAGYQYLSYYGGWFYQDKISWTGKARSKFRIKNRYYYDNPKNLKLDVTSWISGIGSPSFQVDGEIKYDGKFSAKAGANAGVSIDSNGYLVESITSHNHKYASIDYEFNGWKYKVTKFGSWASARAEYDEGKVVNILSNSSFYKVSKLSESIEEK